MFTAKCTNVTPCCPRASSFLYAHICPTILAPIRHLRNKYIIKLVLDLDVEMLCTHRKCI